MDPPEPSAHAWTKYRRAQCIGAGSFGQVYLADGIEEEGGIPGRHVVKSVYIRDLPDQELLTAVNEVQVLKLLQHANVVRYHDHFVDSDGFLNIVMEYCSEGDLAQLIERVKESGGFFTEAQVAFKAFQLLQAMKYIHSIDIIHRDLKPANIFLTRDHTLKIADFGISKLVGGSSVAQTVVGTPFYLSPEICESRPYNHSADVWSAGCVIYEIAAMEKAFVGSNILAVVRKVTECAYTALPPRYKRVSALLSRMLVVDPQQRATVGALITEFYTGGIDSVLPSAQVDRGGLTPTGVEKSYTQWGSELETGRSPRRREDRTDDSRSNGRGKRSSGSKSRSKGRRPKKGQGQRACAVIEARMPELEFHLLPSQKCLLVGGEGEKVVFRRDRALRPMERSGRRPSDSFAAAGSGELVEAARAAAHVVQRPSNPPDASADVGDCDDDGYGDDFERDEDSSGDGYSDESFERYDQPMSDDAHEQPHGGRRKGGRSRSRSPAADCREDSARGSLQTRSASPLRLSDADVANIRRALEIDQTTTIQTREVRRRHSELSRRGNLSPTGSPL
eukprot:TRINITY_DN5598_c0_g1_i2.p1 TRINITY_DN5598_c0_g1~~TRINITY_DN5598_c0_g1_i2.p1  ORF type:complete len:598 (+),score=89.40 TRINITY_DN5598_c0_g1_i2:108-1796(+)